MILVTGAGGKTGQAISHALARWQTPVRALVRSAAQQSELLACGATEAVIGDLRDPSALHTATQGITSLYHICPNMQPDEVAIAQLVIQAAQANLMEQEMTPGPQMLNMKR